MPRLEKRQLTEKQRLDEVLAAIRASRGYDFTGSKLDKCISPVASPMHSGIDGDCWRIGLLDGSTLFLKLYSDDTSEFLDLITSFTAADRASRLGIAPQLLWSDEALCAALWEFIGDGWRTALFDDSWNRKLFPRVAASIREFHRAELIGCKRDVFTTLETYVDVARARNVRLPFDFDWMLENARQVGHAIKASGFDHVPCHGDLIASNILVNQVHDLFFVDWDEACDSDPYWDLGMFMTEAFPFDAGALEMLEAYCGRPDRVILARCRLYGIVGDLCWAVRSLMLAHQTSRPDVEYFKYGQWRALRCRVSLHDPKFEQMLRAI